MPGNLPGFKRPLIQPGTEGSCFESVKANFQKSVIHFKRDERLVEPLVNRAQSGSEVGNGECGDGPGSGDAETWLILSETAGGLEARMGAVWSTGSPKNGRGLLVGNHQKK